jgi:pyruvate-ferredoxin/flavodoxin oxidoreductase
MGGNTTINIEGPSPWAYAGASIATMASQFLFGWLGGGYESSWGGCYGGGYGDTFESSISGGGSYVRSGKRSKKMDLGGIMMSYGNVYVAQVAMGADPNQLIKAVKEAEEYEGPSVIVAYTPCVSHGIRNGMHKVQEEMKRAVDSGYWLLYRYDPRRQHPFMLDSKAPSMGYEEFLDGETRYSALKRTFPENAEKLFAIGTEDAAWRYEYYKHLEEK